MSLPRLKYFIQCDEVKQDQGKYSPLGIFDTIRTLVFPTYHKKFSLLIGLLDCAPGKHEIKVDITAPNGEVFGKIEGTFTCESADQTVNVVFNVEQCPLPMEGEYGFTVFVQGDVLCQYAFRAVMMVKHKENVTPEELAKLIGNPEIIQSANADVECPKCHAKYRFQVHLDPKATLEKGCLPFPPGFIFRCMCKHEINLADAHRNLTQLVGLPSKYFQNNENPPK